MKSVKIIIAAALFASTAYVSGQAPAVEQNLKQDIAYKCPTWPICRGEFQVTDNTDDNAEQQKQSLVAV